VTPYLNLFRGDVRGVPSYYTLVRPQLDQQAAINRQSESVKQLGRNVTAEFQRFERQTLPPTGHSVQYRNFSHFYNKSQ
jgi:hypothetical protein